MVCSIHSAKKGTALPVIAASSSATGSRSVSFGSRRRPRSRASIPNRLSWEATIIVQASAVSSASEPPPNACPCTREAVAARASAPIRSPACSATAH